MKQYVIRNELDESQGNFNEMKTLCGLCGHHCKAINVTPYRPLNPLNVYSFKRFRSAPPTNGLLFHYFITLSHLVRLRSLRFVGQTHLRKDRLLW